MRLGEKFALLFAICVTAVVLLTATSLSRDFVTDKAAYLSDFQTARAIAMGRELTQDMNLFYADIEVLLRAGKLRNMETASQLIPGLLGAERWQNGRAVSFYPSSRAPAAPSPGDSPWALVPSLYPGGFRWIGRFEKTTIVLDLSTASLREILSASHGAVTQLASPEGLLLFTSQPVSPSRPLLDQGILGQTFHEPVGVPKTLRYQTALGEDFLTSFVKLDADPPSVIALITPWSLIERTLSQTLRRATGMATLVLILSVLVGIGFSRTLAKPLRVLTNLILQVAPGKLSMAELLPLVHKRDEIGTLARAFLRMTEELKQARVELQRSEQLAAVGKFSAVVAHEIKNPLAGILSNAEIVGRELVEPGSFDRAGVIQANEFVKEEARRANHTIIRLLKFSRQEPIPLVEVELTERIRRTVLGLEPLMKERGVRLELNLPPAAINIQGDANQIHEVLLNLMLNAVDAMASCQDKNLLLSLSVSGESVELAVRDSGEGMPPELQNRLFEPFFTTKPFGQGTGLGLATCHNIVRGHGGSIRAVSIAGKGTTFLVVFPLGTETVKAQVA